MCPVFTSFYSHGTKHSFKDLGIKTQLAEAEEGGSVICCCFPWIHKGGAWGVLDTGVCVCGRARRMQLQVAHGMCELLLSLAVRSSSECTVPSTGCQAWLSSGGGIVALWKGSDVWVLSSDCTTASADGSAGSLRSLCSGYTQLYFGCE